MIWIFGLFVLVGLCKEQIRKVNESLFVLFVRYEMNPQEYKFVY